jgi:hypothetical protein
MVDSGVLQLDLVLQVEKVKPEFDEGAKVQLCVHEANVVRPHDHVYDDEVGVVSASKNHELN